MNNVFELIKSRRSIRSFSSSAVEFEKIALILEAASYAPSSGNLRDFRFIVVTDKNKIKEIAQAASEQYWIESAPLVIVACSDTSSSESFYGDKGKNLFSIQNCAAAIQNILLSAKALDLDSCWVGSFNDEQIKILLDIPENIDVGALIVIGYKQEDPDEREEPELEDLVYFNKFGDKVKNINKVTKEYSEEINKLSAKIKEDSQSLFDKLKNQFDHLTKDFQENLKNKKK